MMSFQRIEQKIKDIQAHFKTIEKNHNDKFSKLDRRMKDLETRNKILEGKVAKLEEINKALTNNSTKVTTVTTPTPKPESSNTKKSVYSTLGKLKG